MTVASTLDSQDLPFSLWPYDPSRAAANTFYVLFAISTIFHGFQLYQYKTWQMTMAFPLGGAIYTAGFVMREVPSLHTNNLGIYIATIVLLYVAPPVYAAANYFILGRVLHYIPYFSPIHPGRVVSAFIGLDLLVEILTGQAAARLSRWDDPNQQKIGGDMIEASLFLQVALVLCFVTLQIVFYRRCRRAGVVTPKLGGILKVIYISNGLIIIRNIYRLIDTFLEYPAVFDVVPMLINSLMINFFNPAIFLPWTNKTYLSQDGHTERSGPGWQDKRHFVVTIIDPFDLGDLATGTDRKTRYWDNEGQHPVVTPEQDTIIPAYSARRSFRVRMKDPLNLGEQFAKQSNNLANNAPK